ncbi:MAG: sugar ABC transporter ATP-binding protein [Armatimonadetes bacterium]|nr:MAG: sugar ABC transporter ATP-binding protein [Armatimonadota bacterium]
MSDLNRAESPPLEVRDVTKSYGAVTALRGVSFKLHAGEVVALVGDNGAGKSTLVKIISGILEPSSGSILVDGVEQRHTTPAEAQDSGIQTVFQDLSLIPTLDIVENIYLHRELFHRDPIRSRLRWMDRKAMRREAKRGLSDLGLQLPSLRTKVAALSGGQRQSVAIARAVLWGSKIVLLDEPTAALGVQQTEAVLSFIESLRERGIAVLVVSHNMEDVLRVSDRIVVLRLGQKIAEVDRDEASHDRIVKLVLGLDVDV